MVPMDKEMTVPTAFTATKGADKTQDLPSTPIVTSAPVTGSDLRRLLNVRCIGKPMVQQSLPPFLTLS